jgi:hypothetical protein
VHLVLVSPAISMREFFAWGASVSFTAWVFNAVVRTIPIAPTTTRAVPAARRRLPAFPPAVSRSAAASRPSPRRAAGRGRGTRRVAARTAKRPARTFAAAAPAVAAAAVRSVPAACWPDVVGKTIFSFKGFFSLHGTRSAVGDSLEDPRPSVRHGLGYVNVWLSV